MKKERNVTEEYMVCDGCGYLLDASRPMVTVSVPFDYPVDFLRGEPAGTLEFHFHAMQNRHDCFRYWAHNPPVMRRTLTERGLDPEQVDDFMSMMLYRDHSYQPGVAREKTTA